MRRDLIEEFYQKHRNVHLSDVIGRVEEMYKKGIWIEINTLIIPGENDNEAELKGLSSWISSIHPNIPFHLSSFHPDYKFTSKPRTSLPMMERAKTIALSSGLHFLYMCSLSSPAASHTLSPMCGGSSGEEEGGVPFLS
jgi:pyruvate formate lyase activating enzyme